MKHRFVIADTKERKASKTLGRNIVSVSGISVARAKPPRIASFEVSHTFYGARRM